MIGSNRGQAHTLEAVAAALILLASVTFALQATAVTPLTGSTSSQHIENQQQRMAEGLLTAETDNGTVSPTIRAWNATDGRFHDASGDGYTGGGPPTPFGAALDKTFLERGIAFNVYVHYPRGDGRETVQLVNLGSPSDHATAARRLVTLYDDDPVLEADTTPKEDENGDAVTVSDDDEFYVDADVSEETNVYSVVEVEVVIWRM